MSLLSRLLEHLFAKKDPFESYHRRLLLLPQICFHKFNSSVSTGSVDDISCCPANLFFTCSIFIFGSCSCPNPKWIKGDKKSLMVDEFSNGYTPLREWKWWIICIMSMSAISTHSCPFIFLRLHEEDEPVWLLLRFPIGDRIDEDFGREILWDWIMNTKAGILFIYIGLYVLVLIWFNN